MSALPSYKKQNLYFTNSEEWERDFAELSGVTRMDIDNFGKLCERLKDQDEADSYLTSPAYYSFTGRHGLWMYEKGDDFLLVCWHPNVTNQILVFSLSKSQHLIADLLEIMPMPPAGIRIARQPSDATVAGTLTQIGRQKSLQIQTVEETVLDWKFPVRILSTDRVAEHAGAKFMHIRNRVRQLKSHALEVHPLNAINFGKAMENLLHRWATHNAANPHEYEMLYAPYESLFSWSMEKEAGLSGILISVDGVIEAIGIWDVSNATNRTANLFVDFCNTSIAGLSEFLTIKCCETLQDQGIKFLNLGGSEAEGLDRFKKKFDPVNSVSLTSIEAKSLYQVAEEMMDEPNVQAG